MRFQSEYNVCHTNTWDFFISFDVNKNVCNNIDMSCDLANPNLANPNLANRNLANRNLANRNLALIPIWP